MHGRDSAAIRRRRGIRRSRSARPVIGLDEAGRRRLGRARNRLEKGRSGSDRLYAASRNSCQEYGASWLHRREHLDRIVAGDAAICGMAGVPGDGTLRAIGTGTSVGSPRVHPDGMVHFKHAERRTPDRRLGHEKRGQRSEGKTWGTEGPGHQR